MTTMTADVQLEAQRVLERHHATMTDYLVIREGFAPEEAELAVQHLPARIAARMVKEWGFEPVAADDAFARAVLWLQGVADGTTDRAPTDHEDAGWHMLKIYDPEDRALGTAMQGKVISHLVNDIPGYPRGEGYCTHDHCDVKGGTFRGGSVATGGSSWG